MIILGILAFEMLIAAIGIFVYDVSDRSKKFFHDLLDWHRPAKNAIIKIEGPNKFSYCEFCGKLIMQDSRGDWY